MLKISRKVNTSFTVGPDIKVTLLDVQKLLFEIKIHDEIKLYRLTPFEKFWINSDVSIKPLRPCGAQLSIVIYAPLEYTIFRDDIIHKKEIT